MDAYIKILKPLIGGKITKIIVDPAYDDTYMGLIVEKGKKVYEVISLRDPEGNGAGFITVTDITSANPMQQKKVGVDNNASV